VILFMRDHKTASGGEVVLSVLGNKSFLRFGKERAPRHGKNANTILLLLFQESRRNIEKDENEQDYMQKDMLIVSALMCACSRYMIVSSSSSSEALQANPIKPNTP
jgi:hypothetical protein